MEFLFGRIADWIVDSTLAFTLLTFIILDFGDNLLGSSTFNTTFLYMHFFCVEYYVALLVMSKLVLEFCISKPVHYDSLIIYILEQWRQCVFRGSQDCVSYFSRSYIPRNTSVRTRKVFSVYFMEFFSRIYIKDCLVLRMYVIFVLSCSMSITTADCGLLQTVSVL